MALRGSQLQDQGAVEAFFQQVAASFRLEDIGYLILLAYDSYDVPYRGKDGGSLEDASETVYSYILCSLCPVKETKPVLSYRVPENLFRNREVDWVIAPPEAGFLFPAFDDRSTNLYNALYYNKNAEDVHEDFIAAVFATQPPMPAALQKETFRESLAEALGQSCSMDVVQVVYSQLDGMLTEHKESGREEPLTVTAKDLAHILQGCEVPEENIQAFQSLCDEKFGEGVALNPANLIEPGKVEIKTPQVSLTVEADYSPLVQTRVIDGQKYLLIPAGEGVEFNGLAVKIPGELEEAQKEGNGE